MYLLYAMHVRVGGAAGSENGAGKSKLIKTDIHTLFILKTCNKQGSFFIVNTIICVPLPFAENCADGLSVSRMQKSRAVRILQKYI